MNIILEQVIPDTDGKMKLEILKLIEKIYCKKYIGSLLVYRILPIGISARFGLLTDEKPIYISAELDDESYLKYMEKELKLRHFDLSDYFEGYKEYPYHCPHSRKCIKCND